MSHSGRRNADEPLLGRPPKLSNDEIPQPLSSITQSVIKALSIVRLATGAACLVAPRFTCGIFRYQVPAEQHVLVRMFGIRDAVFGELLWTAEDKERADGGRQ